MTHQSANDLLIEIDKNSKSLTPWEKKFLVSIKEGIAKDREISEKQGNVLEKLYRKTQGG